MRETIEKQEHIRTREYAWYKRGAGWRREATWIHGRGIVLSKKPTPQDRSFLHTHADVGSKPALPDATDWIDMIETAKWHQLMANHIAVVNPKTGKVLGYYSVRLTRRVLHASAEELDALTRKLYWARGIRKTNRRLADRWILQVLAELKKRKYLIDQRRAMLGYAFDEKKWRFTSKN